MQGGSSQVVPRSDEPKETPHHLTRDHSRSRTHYTMAQPDSGADGGDESLMDLSCASSSSSSSEGGRRERVHMLGGAGDNVGDEHDDEGDDDDMFALAASSAYPRARTAAEVALYYPRALKRCVCDVLVVTWSRSRWRERGEDDEGRGTTSSLL